MVKQLVLHQAYTMLSSKRVQMSFNDDYSLYALLANLKNRLLGKNSHHIYTYFNFPLAFLLLGLLDQYEDNLDISILQRIEIKLKDLITIDGKLKFKVDKVDQATFGLVFLRLYKLTKKEVYLQASHLIYEYIKLFKKDDGLYRYRKELDVFFIDTIGLVCPFLVHYADITGDESIRVDAEYQVQFALKHCAEPNHGLVFHAFDLMYKQPLGSINWSRGMGWLLLGLSSVAQKSRNTEFMTAMNHYLNVLAELKENHGFWAQFLGHTDDRQIDASGSLMFLYAFRNCEILSIDNALIQSLAAECIDKDGRVMMVSGDTIYINKYSKVKGASELGQGLMLSILAEKK